MGEPLTRAAVLEHARDCVTRDRAATHGRPEDSLGQIAALWSADLGVEITAGDVARLMILLKAARAKGNPGHVDNWIDMAGYAALGGELGPPAPVESPRMSMNVAVGVEFDARGWPYASIHAITSPVGAADVIAPEIWDSGPAVAATPPAPGAGEGHPAPEAPLMAEPASFEPVSPADRPETEPSAELGATASAEVSGAAVGMGSMVLPRPAAAPRESAPQLTDAEKRAVWEAYQAGEMPAAIARRIGQPRARIANLITAIKSGKLKAVSAAPPASRAADPEPAPELIDEAPEVKVGSSEASESSPPAAELNRVAPSEAKPASVEARCDAPPEEDDWSPDEDVTVLRGFGAGIGSYKISQQLRGRNPADVVNRYKVLVPERGIVAQTKALKHAEARLAAAGGVAAE